MVFRSIRLRDVLRPSSSVKPVLVLSFVMILATVVFAVAGLWDLRERELAHARGEINSLSRILADQTARTFDGVVLTMSGARDRISDNFGRRFTLDSYPVHLLLQARISGLPQVKSIFVVDKQGLGVNSSRNDFIPRLSVANREFFRYFADGGTDEIFISRPEKARVDDQWTYYVSMPLLDSSGHLRGVLAASISINYFESLYETISLDSVSRILLLNREGQLLAGKPHDEERFGKDDGSPSAIAQLRAQPEGGVVVAREASDEGGRFVAYRQVARYPLVISAAVEVSDALTPWRHVAILVISSVVLILLLVSATTFLMVRNILRKGLLEVAIKESDAQLRHMVQSVRDAIVTVDSARRIVLFNMAAERMFGIAAEEAIGREVGDCLSRTLRPPQLMSLIRYLDEGWSAPTGLILLGVIVLQRDDQEFPVELSLSTTTFRGENLLTAVFRDLAERQMAERELLETNRQLQELSASLQNVREEERVRIARELHDELGQLLTGIRMEVSWLGGRLNADQQGLIDKVFSVKGQIDQTIASVRRISSELRPLVLDDLGFAAAAGWYVDQFSVRTGLAVKLELPAEDPAQGGDVPTALFRVLQESLTNVARHAHATKVDIQLNLHAGKWVLSIRDDGVGFAQDPGKRGGIGLIGMRERVQILGGTFSVVTAPGEGTLLEVVIPVEKMRENNNAEA